MRIDVRHFDPADLDAIEIQPRHAAGIVKLVAEHPELKYLMRNWGYTAWTPYGVPAAICGVLPNGTAWAILAADVRRVMVPLTRAVRAVLTTHAKTQGPVWADIDSTYPEAVRWARALGFREQSAGRWVFGCGS